MGGEEFAGDGGDDGGEHFADARGKGQGSGGNVGQARRGGGGDGGHPTAHRFGGGSYFGGAGEVTASGADDEGGGVVDSGKILKMGPFFGVLTEGGIAGGFEDFGGGEKGGGKVGAPTGEDKLVRVAPILGEGEGYSIAGGKGTLGGLGQGGKFGTEARGGFRGELAALFANMDGEEAEGDLIGGVGAHTGGDEAGFFGEGRGFDQDGLAGGLADKAIGVGGEGDGMRADLIGKVEPFGSARDAAGNRDTDDDAARWDIGHGVAGELEGGHGFAGETREFFKGPFGGEGGVVRIATAGDEEALDGEAGFAGEGGTDGVVIGFNDGTDEVGDAVDLIQH